MPPIVTVWNKPVITDEMLRSYCNEIVDCMGVVLEERAQKECCDLAVQVMRVVYGTYYFGEKGCGICLAYYLQ